MSTLSLWSVIASGAVCAVGCAAAQIDDMPNDSGSGAEPATAGKSGSAGGSGGAGQSAGTSNATAGTAPKAGGSNGGASAGGTGGAGHAGTATTGGSGGAPPNKPANTNLPYTEDFEDGEPQGFIEWNEDKTQGPWTVVADGGGKIYQPQAAPSDLEFAVGGSTTWTDVTFTVKVRLNDADSGAQIVLRFKDPKTYLVVEMAIGKYKLRGRADGSTEDLVAPSPKPVIEANKWYTVGITAKGSAVSLTLDDMPIGMATCDAAISNGGIALGVAEGNVSFDDLNVVAAE